MWRSLLFVVGGLTFFTTNVFAENFAWHYLYTQEGRNEAIIRRAQQDLGKYVGLNCKNWVRKVIYEASQGEISIPQTLPNEDGWYWASQCWIEELCTYPEHFRPGAVLQMNWQGKTEIVVHTAIVTGMTSSGVYLIESNWNPPYGKTVSQRFVSFSDFYQKAVRYTVHYIH